MLVATMRLGFVPFPISIRNSPAGVAHLLSRTHVIQLYVSPDPAMRRLCAEAVALLAEGNAEDGGVQVEVLPVVQFAEIEDAAWEGAEEPQVAFGKLDLDSVACLMHSSGAPPLLRLRPRRRASLADGAARGARGATQARRRSRSRYILAIGRSCSGRCCRVRLSSSLSSFSSLFPLCSFAPLFAPSSYFFRPFFRPFSALLLLFTCSAPDLMHPCTHLPTHSLTLTTS